MFGTKRRPSKMRRVISAGGGAALMYLLDPEQGRSRRAKLKDQLAGLFRAGAREVGRKAEYARGQASGLKHLGGSGSLPENDATLTAKVESEVLSRWSYPKGRISVNSVDGVVELRGTCDSQDQIRELERDVRKVTGVAEVHNFLHVPGTPAPNKQDALNRS
jgi:osmotically-inducible protein OsmY